MSNSARRCFAAIASCLVVQFTTMGLAQATEPVLAAIKVVDEQSKPVAAARGNLMWIDEKHKDICGPIQEGWTSASEAGVISWRKSNLPPYLGKLSGERTCEAVVQAPGFAWATTTVTLGASRSEDAAIPQIILRAGREIELVLKTADGRAIPNDLIPVVTDPRHFIGSVYSLQSSEVPTERSWSSITTISGQSSNRQVVPAALFNARRSSLATVQAIGAMQYKFRIPDGDAAPVTLYILVHHSGFLRAFIGGPFGARDLASGKLEITLPPPHTMKVELRPLKGRSWSIMKSEGSLDIERPFAMRPDWNNTLRLEAYTIAPGEWSRADWEARDLAPGLYNVSVDPDTQRTGGRGFLMPHMGVADLRDKTSATVVVQMDNDTEPANEEARAIEKAALASFQPIVQTKLRDGGDVQLHVRVTDENDQPVTSAQAIVTRENGHRLDFNWRTAGADGVIPLQKEDVFQTYLQGEPQSGKHAIIVRAPGYAPATLIEDLPTSRMLHVTLNRGRKVRLSLVREDGAPAPTTASLVLVPKLLIGAGQVALETGMEQYRGGDGMSLSDARAMSPGMFEVNLPDPMPDFYVLMNAPGFCRGFVSEPITNAVVAKENGQVELRVPAVTQLNVSLRPPGDADPATLPYSACGVELVGNGFQFHCEQATSTGLDLKLDDVPEGKYQIEAYTGKPTTKYDKQRPGYYQERRTVQLARGTTTNEQFTWRSNEVKPTGTARANVKVQTFDGKPAAGDAFAVLAGGRNLEQVVETGRVPDDGVIRLQKLPVATEIRTFDVNLGSTRAGFFIAPKNGETTDVAFTLPPRRGDRPPDVVLRDLQTSEVFKLSDLRGKVVILDFWASWCGPCRPATKDTNLLAERRADWENKVAVLGVTIDDTPQRALTAIREQRLNAWRPVISEGSLTDTAAVGWDAPAAKAYVIQGIPKWYILDAAGTITASQGDSMESMEKAVDALLKK